MQIRAIRAHVLLRPTVAQVICARRSRACTALQLDESARAAARRRARVTDQVDQVVRGGRHGGGRYDGM
jgi:hypothetical protein